MSWEYRILQSPGTQAFENTLTELTEFEVIGFSSASSKDGIMLSVLLRRPKPKSDQEALHILGGETVEQTVRREGSWFPDK